ncbi:hypothetical protein [Vibrio furnissii]|uniref:hypothetical protein n=1 Tax=Vibrio furnissii TaxID=29494 RepID=UPI001EEB8D6C|nr:hypothetical protein [Vibrio furnissii]
MAKFQTISEDVQYWFIRSGNSGGKFFHHFKHNNVVALGHADDIDFGFEDGHLLNKNDQGLIIGRTKIKFEQSGESPSQIANKSNQVRRFVSMLKPGDIVVTINDEHIMAGTVRTPVYYGTVGLVSDTERKKSSKSPCYFNLRCGVTWGATKSRGLMPLELEKAFRFTGSIMQFADEAQIRDLNHWLYPVHLTENEIRCTLRINSREELSNRQLTRLSVFLDELELLASYIERQLDGRNEYSIDEYRIFADMHRETYQYSLKAQHLFMSPGHQFLQLGGSVRKSLVFGYLIMALLSGSADAASNVDLPEQISSLNNPIISHLVQQFGIDLHIEDIQDSLSVKLNTPSLPDVPADSENVSQEINSGDEHDGWGATESDNSAL